MLPRSRGCSEERKRPVVAFLRFVSGGLVGQTVALDQATTILGRHPSCDVVLDFAEVSRHHARIFENHGSYFIEDLRSRNGTMVNGTAITTVTPLRDGDRVRLCQVEFVFHDGVDPDASSADSRSLAAAEGASRLEAESSGRSRANGTETVRPTSGTTLRALPCEVPEPGGRDRTASSLRGTGDRQHEITSASGVAASTPGEAARSSERALVSECRPGGVLRTRRGSFRRIRNPLDCQSERQPPAPAGQP